MIQEKTFNKWFNVFILLGMTIAMILTTAIKLGNADSGKALLLVAAVGSLMGILSTVCSANGKIMTFFFGFFDVTIYAVMCFISGKYGNAFLHALYFVPMQFVGLWQWRKRGAEGDKQVKARRFNMRQWWLYSALFLAGSIVAYLVLCRFDAESSSTFLRTVVLMDAISMVCNILGQLLMSMAYMEQWVFWILVNISTVTMWCLSLGSDSDSYAIIYIIKYAFYFLNSLNGLRIWIKLSKNGIDVCS